MSHSIEEIDLTEAPNVKKTIQKRKREPQLQVLHEDPIIICPRCPLTFTRRCNYNKHLEYAHSKAEDLLKTQDKAVCSSNKYTKEKFYECTQCPRKFVRQINLTKHLETHFIHQSFVCKECNMEFLDLRSLEEHASTHSNQSKESNDNEKNIPKKETNEKDILEKELDEKNTSKIELNEKDIFEIEPEEKDTSKNETNKKDTSKDTENSEEPLDSEAISSTNNDALKTDWVCNLCNRNFFYQSALDKHKEKHLTKEATFFCRHCPQKFFQRTNLVQHEYTHTRSTHVCDICNRAFNKVFNLKSHRKVHNLKLSCDQCKKDFKTKKSLEIHIKNHSKTQRNRCKTCDTRFAHKTTLLRHTLSRIRNGIKYLCKNCGLICCNKKILDRHNCDKHMKVPFRCGECNMTCDNKEQFQKHMYTHVEGQPQFSCDSCKAVFPSESGLLKHTFSEDGSELQCVNCNKLFKCARRLKSHYCGKYGNPRKRPRESHEKVIANYTNNKVKEGSYRMRQNRIKHKDHTYALQCWPIKPYQCRKCGKHFCRLVNLEKHLQEIHPLYQSAGSSDEEEKKMLQQVEFTVPKITSVTSLNMGNENFFMMGDNIQDHVDQADQLVDPLLLDDQPIMKESSLEVNHFERSPILKNIVRIEHRQPEVELQRYGRHRISEVNLIDIKHETIDYESS